ncbi:uncharacterized protein LOC121371555 isoform X2 [Gigantopelta aegis]|nr:uncharacterized protein LOC121371555 isoform X2 [Gigantopelta aegis]XP_041353475.1 uncharacterized protein LOC121371555 isoform X2 [Gigantopelta aegis]
MKSGVAYIEYLKKRYDKMKDYMSTAASSNISCDSLKDDAQTPCIDNTCNVFFSTPEENWKKMENYPSLKYDEYLAKMKDLVSAVASGSEKKIVMVTAATSEYFYRSQGLLQELHEKVLRYYNNVFLIYYDLGLHPCERRLIEKYCRCEVKDFPFEIFPAHVKHTKNYAWRPLLIQLELLQHEVVAWFDTSVRFKPQIVANIFRKGVSFGIMPLYGEFSVAQQSDVKIFQWFGEEPCSFSNYFEIQTGHIMFYKSSLVESIIKYWVTCALNKECISPENSVYDCDSSTRKYGKCHRFDQSALSIILTRLFQESRAVLHLTKFVLHKRQPVHYFPEEPSLFCLQ